MPEQEQFTDFQFPFLGLDVTTEYELQRPNTAIIAINVRVFETLTGRGRGGSRPGLSKFIAHDLSDPRPVQCLAILVDPSATTGLSYGGLNADTPADLGGWSDNPETDPSTNNLVEGAGLIRNMEVVGGSIDPRVLRTGGSGRPQYRIPGTAGPCVERTYHIHTDEVDYIFVLDSDNVPQNFAAIMTTAGIMFTADPSIWNTGPTLPTKDDINALAAMDTGWIAAGADCSGTTDGDCPG